MTSSNNDLQPFDLDENRKKVNEDFLTEASQAFKELQKAADEIVRTEPSVNKRLGLMRDAADDLNLRNQPDDALREFLSIAEQGLTDPHLAVCEGDHIFEWETATTL